jgi:hypothetical protein
MKTSSKGGGLYMSVAKKHKMCVSCEKQKVQTSFFSTNSKMFTDGKVPICKACIKEQVDEKDISSVKRILRQIDKPFISTVWSSATNSEKDTFGSYMKMINSLPQYKTLTYEDSIENKAIDEDSEDIENDEDIKEMTTDGEVIKVTNEIKLKFGLGYKNEEYLKMEKFYMDMMKSHDITSPNHIEMLIEICKVNVEKDRALKDRNIGDYKKLSDASKALIADAGFRPADKVSGNEAVGMRTFSQIFQEIEKDGFIAPAPIEVHEDILDRTIMYLSNYTRRLLNMDVLSTPQDDIDELVHLKGEDDE